VFSVLERFIASLPLNGGRISVASVFSTPDPVLSIQQVLSLILFRWKLKVNQRLCPLVVAGLELFDRFTSQVYV